MIDRHEPSLISVSADGGKPKVEGTLPSARDRRPPPRWDLLVLTDSAELDPRWIGREGVLFIVFDRENGAALRAAGCSVRFVTEYQDAPCLSYTELYERFHGPLETVVSATSGDSGERASDCEMVVEQLRIKVVEFTAPIVYTWDLVDAALTRERPRSLALHVETPWLFAVLNARYGEWMNRE